MCFLFRPHSQFYLMVAVKGCPGFYNLWDVRIASNLKIGFGRVETKGLARALFGDIEGGNPIGFGECGKIKDVFDESIDVNLVK